MPCKRDCDSRAEFARRCMFYSPSVGLHAGARAKRLNTFLYRGNSIWRRTSTPRRPATQRSSRRSSGAASAGRGRERSRCNADWQPMHQTRWRAAPSDPENRFLKPGIRGDHGYLQHPKHDGCLPSHPSVLQGLPAEHRDRIEILRPAGLRAPAQRNRGNGCDAATRMGPRDAATEPIEVGAAPRPTLEYLTRPKRRAAT